MYDYGEYVSPHTLTHSLLPGAAAHNLYPLQYQQAAFEFFMVGREGGREGEGCVLLLPTFTRCSTSRRPLSFSW